MTSGTWIEVQIDAAEDAGELLAAALADAAQGVEIRDQDTIVRADPGRVVVVALVAPDDASALIEDAQAALESARRAGVVVDPVLIRRRAAHEDEWRDVWKQFFRTTRISDRFVVRPSWDPHGAHDGAEIIDLDPGRAFGTGAHPSTRLVAGLAERLAGSSVTRFLDLGCGSGILAIAAARLWPKATGLAVDVDPESADCAQENLDRNRVSTVAVHAGTLAQVEGRFDLIMANILMEVLLDVAPQVRTHLEAGSHVILSGLLGPQAAAVIDCYRGLGLDLVERRDEGEWSALLLQYAGTVD